MKIPDMSLDPFVKAYRFCSQFIDRRNYFEGIYTANDKHWYPKATRLDLIRYHNNPKKKFKRINQQKMLLHYSGRVHLGFTNSPLYDNTHYLLCVDVDFYEYNMELGNLAQELIESWFGQTIYWESSTTGKGLHGYIILNKGHENPSLVRDTFIKIQYLLTQLVKQIGCKCVDICGLPCLYSYTNKTLQDVVFSTPAKLPRDYSRIDELLTLVITDFPSVVSKIDIHHDGGGVDCLPNSDSSIQFNRYTGEKLVGDVNKLWEISTSENRIEFVKGRFMSKQQFVWNCVTWIKAVYASDKKEGLMRGTTPVVGLREYYMAIGGSNFDYRRLKWVGEYLESIGVLIAVNKGYCVGAIARRWKVRIKALDDALRGRIKVDFNRYIAIEQEKL